MTDQQGSIVTPEEAAQIVAEHQRHSVSCEWILVGPGPAAEPCLPYRAAFTVVQQAEELEGRKIAARSALAECQHASRRWAIRAQEAEATVMLVQQGQQTSWHDPDATERNDARETFLRTHPEDADRFDVLYLVGQLEAARAALPAAWDQGRAVGRHGSRRGQSGPVPNPYRTDPVRPDPTGSDG